MRDSIATPALIINAAAVRRNIARMAAYAEEYEIALRPHTKTHKLRRVAEMQIEAGAVGLTTAKVGEAEVMSKVASELLIAYPAVDPARTRRIAKLASHHTVRVAVDSIHAANALAAAARSQAATIGVLVDLDVGLHRTGVQSPDDALRLAQHIDPTAGIRLDGLFVFPGHIWGTPEEQAAELEEVANLVAATIDLWDEHGLEATIVSGGSTPTAVQSHLIADINEIRPGTYVYFDANCMLAGFCSLEDCAAQLVCTVVSTAVPGQVVIDAGSKTLTMDACKPDPSRGHGYIVEYPEAQITKLTEEHGQVDVSGCERQPEIGERVTVIPNHVCPCVNLQNSIWWEEEDGSVEELRVDARGLLS